MPAPKNPTTLVVGVVRARIYDDTQIFKTLDEDTITLTFDEAEIINRYKYLKFYIDYPNLLLSFSFPFSQKKEPNIADEIVDLLNDISLGNWFVGDIEEEYVHCE